MKYVRTKDERILKSFRDEMSTLELETLIAQEIIISNDEIIAQADTIEDLCDKFVLITEIGIWERTSYRSMKSERNCYNKVRNDFIKEIYGAIWTEWGLKYVAKMNDKGDWELL